MDQFATDGTNCSISDSIPQQLYRPEQVREMEAEAAARAGVDMWELMQRAGAAGWQCLQQQSQPHERVAVLCGPGNNGGDGYVLAALARDAGRAVRLFASAEPKSEDGQRALQLWLDSGGDVEPLLDWSESEPDWVVDGLLGTGIDSDLRGDIRECVEAVNEAKLSVLALDIPTGLHGDTGCALGDAIVADHTVTFVGVKRGLCTGAAAAYRGKLWFADLGIQREFRLLTEPAAWNLQQEQLTSWLPRRSPYTHKGVHGHVLILGGSRGMAGAARLAGSAALRAGAGKVTVICEPGQEYLVGQQPELMVLGLEPKDAQVAELMEQATVFAMGPGLGQQAWGKNWWSWYLDGLERSDPLFEMPTVLDADALNWLARSALEVSTRSHWVLTPHPGEAARLLDCHGTDVEANRWLAAQTLQEQFGGVVVLKGAGSVICGSEGTAVSQFGTPAMASAGMGDVLTGMISALMAQANGLSITMEDSVRAAVMVHGLAGESAAQSLSQGLGSEVSRGLLASDLFPWIVQWMNPNDA
ncbi:NAD(P)H-hydrate dehydratase [Aliidiomarina halalkaliphila]|uniref:Bifunctional NAD(P)H-hydrate repair enzyme n=1 Tax=Aliidiomarina halalkaliphila TaxID=2593535 RepID=A0A552X1Y5_9GAMM|nr:NAD(P)H-hydrate dehydratase [Aliidiomarina halalkaliphila]TRW49037.1 NAD(P)H-hydrate dehydratase [Aliidiomarina halalkaliphila]